MAVVFDGFWVLEMETSPTLPVGWTLLLCEDGIWKRQDFICPLHTELVSPVDSLKKIRKKSRIIPNGTAVNFKWVPSKLLGF